MNSDDGFMPPSPALKIEPIEGEPDRYFVASRSRGEPHLVDLAEFDGNGQCGCEDFDYRFRKTLEEAQERGQRVTKPMRCWHLKQAFAVCREGRR